MSLALLMILPVGAQQESFSSHANLVLVPTLVRDAAGNAVYGLNAEDFVVEDDNAVQLAHLDESAEADPISLVIAVECGRRAKREFDRMRGLPAILDPVLSDGRNEAALLLFDSKLDLVENFLKSRENRRAPQACQRRRPRSDDCRRHRLCRATAGQAAGRPSAGSLVNQ